MRVAYNRCVSWQKQLSFVKILLGKSIHLYGGKTMHAALGAPISKRYWGSPPKKVS